jgi:isochorismate synthase
VTGGLFASGRGDTPASGDAMDLLSLWQPGGFLLERDVMGVVGTGEARRLEIPPGRDQAVRAARLADAALAELGIGDAVIVGSLPFRGDRAASLFVPESVTVATAASRTVQVVSRTGTGAMAMPVPAGRARPRATAAGDVARGNRDLHGRQLSPLVWQPEPSVAGFGAAVAEAVRRIGAGRLTKVVLARSLVAANPGIDVRTLLAELRRRNPGCHLFASPAGAAGTFLGATPETLVRREGDQVLSLPVAGTAARSPEPGRDALIAAALLRSAKDLHEHAPVVEAVTDALAPYCSELAVEPTPHLLATATAWHLASSVRGTLRPPAPSALELAAALHPTPAVCGTPTDAAAALIEELEPAPRGLYAGLVGWVDGRGDGEWVVSVRCALITPRQVRLDAGAGIVAGSDPAAEIAETDVKFRTLIESLEAIRSASVQALPA